MSRLLKGGGGEQICFQTFQVFHNIPGSQLLSDFLTFFYLQKLQILLQMFPFCLNRKFMITKTHFVIPIVPPFPCSIFSRLSRSSHFIVSSCKKLVLVSLYYRSSYGSQPLFIFNRQSGGNTMRNRNKANTSFLPIKVIFPHF